MDKLISLARKTGIARFWTPTDMMNKEIVNLESGERNANKAIIVFLDDADGNYDIGFGNAGMENSEILAVLEVAKTMILKDMEYL